METVLIIEDDSAILYGLSKNLRYEGYGVITATDGDRGLDLAVEKRPDLIVLDIMLPGLNGFEICKALKNSGIDIPIVILSARDTEIDKIMGLDLGADDYMTKPFSVRELVARVNAVLRRKKRYEQESEVVTFADVEIDFTGRTVTRGGEALDLSPREFDLLTYFVRNPSRVLERRQILNKVWGYNYLGTSRTIDNFVTKLRQKLEEVPDKPKHFVTVRGVGYKFLSGSAG